MQYRYADSQLEPDLYEHISNLEAEGWDVAQLGAYGVLRPHESGGDIVETTWYVYMQKADEAIGA